MYCEKVGLHRPNKCFTSFFTGHLERVNNHGRNLRKRETALSKEEASEDTLKLLINRE